ncbi:metalloenzyme [Oscillochloris sp. ZM17-4]|uniref:metalloenzyme n=1 Tax=Oscillochloris sp. ZM17-4 TaxID=2866714 RepID=UPI001C72AAAD|nr:metalloenzyme [Oscillochloris sp. ZM17-4]MBX0330221.1 metalloenzyme [Oscillochloris sp. ZM17-4]
MSIIFVFLDGVGMAPITTGNPLATTPMGHMHALLGGPLSSEAAQARPGLLLRPIDAALGVDGLPQSGTGHVALLAGVNAPALHGRHQPNFPPVALRPLLAERSLFRLAGQSGHSVAFANAFSAGYWQAIAARRIRRSASVIAAEGAGLPLRDLDDLRAGRALSWDITRQAIHSRGEGEGLPLITPDLAGAHLADIARAHRLVFFECFLPDLAGHGRMGADGVHEALVRIDGLLGGLLAAKQPADTVLITSDHGNIEDSRTPSHTRSPVPLLVIGPDAERFAGVERIDQVAPAILANL